MRNSARYKVPRSWLHQLGRICFSVYVKVVFRTYLRVKVHAAGALPAGSYILYSNHQSHLDAIILGYLRGWYHHTAFIAAKDYWYDHQWRFRLSNLFFNLIPISRENGNGFSIRQTLDAVKEFTVDGSKAVIILPEGTRSKDGSIKTFKPGIVTLAKESELPVVPVYIQNSGRFWPKGSHFIRPGSLHVWVGKPILPEQITAADDLRTAIVSLSQQAL